MKQVKFLDRNLLVKKGVFNSQELIVYSKAGGDPGPIPPQTNLLAWYDPSDISTLFQQSNGTVPVTADGDVVGYIGDKTGNGNNMVQGTSAAKLRYTTAGFNGRNCVRNDGVDDQIRVPSGVMSAGVRTVHAVVKAELPWAASGYDRIINFDTSNTANTIICNNTSNDLIFNNSNTTSFRQNGVDIPLTTGYALSPDLYTATLLSLLLSITGNGAGDHGGFGSIGSNNPMGGVYGELLFYGAELTVEELDAVDAYLMTKWGIS